MMIGNSAAAPAPLQRAGDPQDGEQEPATRDAPSQPGEPVTALSFRLFLKWTLYLVAILLLPGALIAVALHWWLDRRRIRGNS